VAVVVASCLGGEVGGAAAPAGSDTAVTRAALPLQPIPPCVVVCQAVWRAKNGGAHGRARCTHRWCSQLTKRARATTLHQEPSLPVSAFRVRWWRWGNGGGALGCCLQASVC